jgi:NADH:ubiquinone oxidoreductase subunit H
MVLSVIFFNTITCVACLFFLFMFIIIRAISPRYTFAQLMALC